MALCSFENESPAKVADLLDSEGRLQSDDCGKAETLNSYFQTVFTREELLNMPHFEQRFNGDPMISIDIDKDSVLAKLKNLKVTKSAGPDDVHPRILSEVAEEIA